MSKKVCKKASPHSKNKSLSLNLKLPEESESLSSYDIQEFVVGNHHIEIRSLLSELVNTVAAILTSRPVHVWQVYGGFQRICEAVLNIFHHGCKHKDNEGNPDIWPFIVGLRVLSPVLGPCNEVTSVSQPGKKWIYSSIQKLQLAAKITALTFDRDYVEKHYHPWALFCSQTHINAVKTCLKALEANSQDGLADIDPKLLIGEYYPPPGTPVLNHSETKQNRKSSNFKSQFSDAEIDTHSGKDVLHQKPHKKITKSLPTTPVADKPWTLPPSKISREDTSNDKTVQRYRKLSRSISTSCRTANIDILKVKDHHHPFLKRGNSDVGPMKSSHASISTLRGKPIGCSIDSDELMSSSLLMSRESPDGSSGSSDWPLVSPVSQAVPFKRDSTSPVPVISSSPIARLVKGELVNINEVGGARPKDVHNLASSKSTQPTSTIPQRRISCPALHYQQNLDVSDSSEPISSISPSLLQVNYGGKHSGSEGEVSSVHSGGSGSTEVKTPQLRHRACSGWVVSSHVDSDQDSEETVDGTVTKGLSRRRRRTNGSQHRQSLSVKSLVDSRGVLGSDTSKASTLSKSHSDKPKIDLAPERPEVIKGKLSEFATLPSSSSESQTTMPTPTQCIVKISKADEITVVSTGLEILNTLATSAPGIITTSITSSNSETTKTKRMTHSRSRSDGAQELANKLKLVSSNTAPALETSDMKNNDDSVYVSQTRKRFMDDGGHSITPAADYGVSPRPQPGQSLIGFLSSKDKPYAALDRENAHFNISEAVISALTQMQFDTWQGKLEASAPAGDESDEEIRILEARIREKKLLKRTAAVTTATYSDSSTGAHMVVAPELLAGSQHWMRNAHLKVESTTDYSMYESPQSSTYNSESDLLSELEEEEEEEEVAKCSSNVITRESLSRSSSVSSDVTSAENVAINLLKHFSEQKLPKASELDWLVSEQEVPQKLLPLPTSVAVSPDDVDEEKEEEFPMQLRGTMDWAPPRPQLILSLHKNTKRSVLMGLQRWRCAGCGMRVSESLSHHFRLCHYLGRYFCTTCHKNQTAMIPAKVLHKWDFKQYAVASFSYELLERMKIDPLINVGALNPRLYKKCRHLHQTHIYRLQLFHTLPYVNTCSRAENEKAILGKLPIHWASDPHVYSLDDLLKIKAGQLVKNINTVTLLCIKHVSKCEVCLGRGFICEICCRGDAIFPFQLDSTSLCEICSACYHSGCFSPHRCPRCIRRESRRMSHDVLDREDSFEASLEKDS